MLFLIKYVGIAAQYCAGQHAVAELHFAAEFFFGQHAVQFDVAVDAADGKIGVQFAGIEVFAGCLGFEQAVIEQLQPAFDV